MAPRTRIAVAVLVRDGLVLLTKDWKACVIGGIGLGAVPNIVVAGDKDAARALLRATSLSAAQ